MLEKLRGFTARMRRDRAGAVGVFAAVAMPVLIGMSSLVGEYGYVLLVKTENQRVADLAAYAGAIAYNTASDQTAMTNAANAVAALNGVSASSVKTTLLANSPTGDGSQAVQVQITTNVPVYLAQIVGAQTSVQVAATAAAELSSKASPCVLALSNSGGGMTLSGGTSVSASLCSVGSNTNIAAPCGTKITTTSAAYANSVSLCSSNPNIVTASGGAAPLVKRSSADPLAGTSQVKAAYAGLTNLPTLALSGPSVPTGGDLNFDYNGDAQTIQNLQNQGCNTNLSGNGVWNIVCSAGTHNFGAITVTGGLTINFAVNGSANNTYTFSGSVVNSGGTVINFGPGAYKFAQGVTNAPTMTFAGGSFWFGLGPKNCNGGASYSICNTGDMTFSGPSTFVIADGVFSSGGTNITFGSGTANSFQVGPSTDGYAFNLGGGAKAILADATATSSLFKVKGDIVSSGGGCTVISAAAEHDINGSIDVSGALQLGAGPYYVTGYVAIGGNGGGNATCAGSNFGVQATNVTLVIGGSTTPSNGGCKGQAFCITAGYSVVNLTAPDSGALGGLAVVGPQNSSAGALFSAGASNTSLSGALYFPNGPITMSGGAGLGGGTGQCLEIIGSTVALSGGSAAASNCPALGGSSTSSIQLVQ